MNFKQAIKVLREKQKRAAETVFAQAEAEALAIAIEQLERADRARQAEIAKAVELKRFISAKIASTSNRESALMITEKTGKEANMSRKIDVAFHGSIERIALCRVERSKLYGSSRRIGLDAKGRECASALLTRDGIYVLGPGSTAGMYLNKEGDVLSREDLTTGDEQGRPLHGDDATSNDRCELTGLVPAEALLECVVTAVYEVDTSEIDSNLTAALSQGDIYRAPDKGFLLANEHGVFLLATKPARFDFVGRDHQTMIDDDDYEYPSTSSGQATDDLGFEPM